MPRNVQVGEDPPRERRVISERKDYRERATALLEVEIVDERLPEATLHVFSRELEGDAQVTIKNSGDLPLWNNRIQDWINEVDSVQLFRTGKSLGNLFPGEERERSHGWKVTGAIDVLWELARIFFTGVVRTERDITIEGEVAPLIGYTADASGTVDLPVGEVSVEWN